MRLDRNLREASSCAYPEGYTAPATGMGNRELALMQIGGQGGNGVMTPLEPLMPTLLRLRAKLVPVALEGEDVTAQLMEDSTTFSGCKIYQLKAESVVFSRHKAIHVDYDDIGFYQSAPGHDLVPFTGESFFGCRLKDKTLYEKSFLFQRSGTIKCTKTNLGNNRVLVNPPNLEGGYPLWGYGGFYRLGCPLSQIEQTFFTITKGKEKSALHTVSLSLLKEKSVPVPKGGKLGQETVVFMDKILADQALSLKDSLEGGAGKIEVIYGVDEKGDELIQPYQSFHVAQGEGGSDRVEITFRKG